MKLAPVVLFTFNRPEHTKRTLESLANNDLANNTILFIFSDGARENKDVENIKKVRDYLKEFKRLNAFLSIHIFESESNKGLANSIITGVTQVFLEFDRVIVLEDDLLTSVDFLKFMNLSLDKYNLNDNIGSITGYNPLSEMPDDYDFDNYFSIRTSSYGWGTWKRVWDNVDWKAEAYHKFKLNYKQRRIFNSTGFDRAKRLDMQMRKDAKSWSILFGFDSFIKGKYTSYAKDSKLINIGWDGTGIHSSEHANKNTEKFNDQLRVSSYPLNLANEVKINKELLKLQQKLFGASLKMKLKDLIIFLKNYMS